MSIFTVNEPDTTEPSTDLGAELGADPSFGADGKPHSMQVRNLHKSFGDFDVLKGLNLNFEDDAITTVLGPSGTGKSVLIKHLVGLLEPDDGEVLIFGNDLWKMSQNERYEIRKEMGVLFQDGALWLDEHL